MTRATIDILLVEDSLDDAELVAIALRRVGLDCVIERVETPPDFLAALQRRRPDVVLCDFDLPRFSARAALEIMREWRGQASPFILLSNHLPGDEIDALRRLGAVAYVPKNRLDLLGSAIETALASIGDCGFNPLS